MNSEVRIGDRVKVKDNGAFVTHITPRWAYSYYGTVIRLNPQSVTVRLDDFDGMKIRVDYIDLTIIKRAEAAQDDQQRAIQGSRAAIPER